VNNAVRKYNKNLFKTVQAFGHTKFLELEVDQIFYTNTDYTSTNWEKLNLQASSIHFTSSIRKQINPPIVKDTLTDTVSSNKTESTAEIDIGAVNQKCLTGYQSEL
jgi:predicted nucleotidyltransferase